MWTLAMFSFGSVAIDCEQTGADGVIYMERESFHATLTQLLLFPRENLVTPEAETLVLGTFIVMKGKPSPSYRCLEGKHRTKDGAFWVC